MIGIDNYGFIVQENKLAARTQLGFDKVNRVINFVQEEFCRLRMHEVDQNQMKAKRLIEEARKRETLEFLAVEAERLMFSREDVHSRLIEHYDAVAEEQCFINRFLQEYEMRLVYPKSKWALKVAPFTLRIIEDLHEVGDEMSAQYEYRELENKAINQCQLHIRSIINLQSVSWISHIKLYLDNSMPVSNSNKTPSIAFRYYAIHFLSILTEYFCKYRVKQRRLDIFQLVDARYLALLLPVLKQTLARFSLHLRSPSVILNCPTAASIVKNEEEAEKELEERVLLPLAVQSLRNTLCLMQHLNELPSIIQSILVEHMINTVFDPSMTPLTTFSQPQPQNSGTKLVGKREVKEEVPLPASHFIFNQHHLFHDIICLLCHHGSICRNCTPSELSDAAIVTGNGKVSNPLSPKRSRNAKSTAPSQSGTINSGPAKAINMFHHPTGRKFVLGTGRRSLYHTSIIPDLLQCAMSFHLVVMHQLQLFRSANPLFFSKLKNAVTKKSTKSDLKEIGGKNSDKMLEEEDKNSSIAILHGWETAILPLAFRTIQRAMIVLGRPGHVGSLIPRDMCFLQHIDDAIIAIADVTTLYYTHHPKYPQALAHRLAWALVQSVHHISHHRLSAIFVQVAVLKLVFACALPMYYFQTSASADPIRDALVQAAADASKPPPPPPTTTTSNSLHLGSGSIPNTSQVNTTNQQEKTYYDPLIYKEAVNRYPEELLRDELLIMTQRILAAFAVHHKQSSTITRMCCLNLRVLFREIFVRRSQCEDLLSMNLTSICAPYTASLHKLTLLRSDGIDDDDDFAEGEGGKAMMIVHQSLPSNTLNNRSAVAPTFEQDSVDESIGTGHVTESSFGNKSLSAKKSSSLQRHAHSVSFALNENTAEYEGKSAESVASLSIDEDETSVTELSVNEDHNQGNKMKARLGGVLEEPTMEEDEHQLDDGSVDHPNKRPLEDNGQEDVHENSFDNSLDLEGGDSLTTVSHMPGIAPNIHLPPPSKESKIHSKEKAVLASKKESSNASGASSTTSSTQDPLAIAALKSMKSSTFSVDRYVPSKLFKGLPNPLVPKTLHEMSNHSIFDSEEPKVEKDVKVKDEGSVASESTATTYTASLSANASEGQMVEKEKQSMMKNAQKVLAKNAEAAGANNTSVMYVTLADILMSAAETHLSNAAIFEQILLLVEHIASKSYLCKYVLVETGLPLILQRYLQSRPSNLYMVALTQVCLDALEI